MNPLSPAICPLAMRHLFACMAVALLCGLSARASAAEPSEALRSAVRAYEAGRLGEARVQFERLVTRGEAAAGYNLAVMHLRGEMPKPSNRAALRLLEQAARGGFVTAQVALAHVLEGAAGIPADLSGSQHWYLQAAEAGSVDAQLAAATNFYLGRGTARNPEHAAKWYERAALGGDVGAQYLLAAMHEQGDGVSKDLAQARYWYDRAARNGDPAAAVKFNALSEPDKGAGASKISAPTARP